MTTDADRLLAARLQALVSHDDDADWDNVVARARGRRRTRPLWPRSTLMVAVVAAAFAAVVAPAIALRGPLSHLFTSRPGAPAVVRHDFATLDRGAPPDMAPDVVARRARRVLRRPADGGRNMVMWAAPTKGGGFCTLWAVVGPRQATEDAGGGCDRNRTLPIAPSLSVRSVTPTPRGTRIHGPVVVTGDTLLAAAASVEIRYQDGDVADTPLTWISRPINAGFFALQIPPRHWTRGHAPAAVVVRDARGQALRTDRNVFRHDPFNTPLPSNGEG